MEMENTLRETLKGLNMALEQRTNKVNEIQNSNDDELVAQKRAELQDELEKQVANYALELNSNRMKAIDKLNRDIETIEELIIEYSDKLTDCKITVCEENAPQSEDTITVLEGQTQTAPIATEEGINPFRP